MLDPISVKATTIPDAWHQLIMAILDRGKEFLIQKGSYAGDYRLEFDFVTVQIAHPECRPLEPALPDFMKQAGIPDPVAPGYILGDDPSFTGEPYITYLMTNTQKPGEDYTYGQRLVAAPYDFGVGWEKCLEIDKYKTGEYRNNQLCMNVAQPGDMLLWEKCLEWEIFNQIEHVIDKYKTGEYRNNQLCMNVAQPGDMLLDDPPCLQLIDTRIQDNKLHFMPYFRSWDLWGGFPANLGGLQVMKEYMADEIGVGYGETIACSKGLHLYKYVWELAKMRRGKND